MSRNLPIEGEIFLDHVGHFVADANAARAALECAGFTATPFSIQVAPTGAGGAFERTGTGNTCAMFGNGYVEVLAWTANTVIGREFARALDRHAGLHLAAFAAADAEPRHACLVEADFPVRPIVHMSRPIGTVEGADEARFTVVRAEAGAMPEGRVQILTHHTEAALWQPRWLEHANGACALVALVVASAQPQADATRFMQFLGGDIVVGDDHARLMLDRGEVVFGDAGFLVRATGGPVLDIDLPSMAACAVRVADISRTQRFLDGAGLRCARIGTALQVPFPEALGRGFWLFCEADDDLPWRRGR